MTLSMLRLKIPLSLPLIIFLAMASCGHSDDALTDDALKIDIIVSEHKPLVFFATRNQFPVYMSARLDKNDTSKMIIEDYFQPAVEVPNLVKPLPPETSDDTCVFSDYGAYYLKTNKGNFKILLLPKDDTAINKLITVFDFVCQNSIFGHLHDYSSASENMVTFFYTDYPIEAICYKTTLLFNIIVEQVFNYEARHCAIFGDVALGDRFWAHSVSEIKVGNKWIFFDALFSVMAITNDGYYGSLLDTYKAINDETVQFRHVVPKDTAAGYDYRFNFSRSKVEHIFVFDWPELYITPLMIADLDYTFVNDYFGCTTEDFISLTQYTQIFYETGGFSKVGGKAIRGGISPWATRRSSTRFFIEHNPQF